MYILSQILVFIADGFYVTSMLSKNTQGLIFFLFLSNILFATHYLCLGGLTGAIIVYIDAIYLIVTYFLNKKNITKYNTLLTFITMACVIAMAVVTWQGAISLLPMFSMLSYLTAMLFSNVIIVKSGAFLRNTLNVIYMFILTSYLGAALEICLMISAIVGIVLNYKKSKKANSVNESNNQTITSA